VTPVWRIAADTREYTADDMSGKGAEKTGGRWNRPGSPVVYAASSVALACLETVVHLNLSGFPLNRFLVRIDVPDDVWAARQALPPDSLSVGWSAIPEGRVSVEAGDQWLAGIASALLLVPSVIVPEEFNILVNPRHPDTARLTATKLRPWLFDQRLGARAAL
jgi:RES domain-containing protein